MTVKSVEFRPHAKCTMTVSGSERLQKLDGFYIKHLNLGIRGFVESELEELAELLADRALVLRHPHHDYILGVLAPAFQDRDKIAVTNQNLIYGGPGRN